jgi:hypothetical protein
MEILETPKGRGSTHGVHLIQSPSHTKLSITRGILYSSNKGKTTAPLNPAHTYFIASKQHRWRYIPVGLLQFVLIVHLLFTVPQQNERRA